MSEEHAGQATEQNRAEKADASKGAGDERVYKQADVDAITEKVRASEAKRAAALEKELAALRDKSMTEQEKAIKEAEERGKSVAGQEWRGKAIRAALVASGIDAEKASALARLAPDDVDDPAEAVGKLREGFPELFGQQQKRVPPGGGLPNGNSGPENAPWTPDRVREVIQRGEYDKYRDEIIAYQAKHSPMIQTRAPGATLDQLKKG